jgi:AraC-like DNA-binding protein
LTEPPTEPHLRDLARLRRIRDRIDREYARPLDVEALARGAHMSGGHLSRQFRLTSGESPYSYLMTRRIERAMALLRRGDLSVTEVCFAVGFVQEPTEQPYGVRDCAFRDPAGNLIRIQELHD